MDITQLLPVFLTGLFAGGISCMAVQGGLLATLIAQRQQERLQEKKNIGEQGENTLPLLSFLAAKIVAYTFLGLLLGWLGSMLHFSLQLQVALLLFVSFFMIGTALNMLNVHPLFRYFVIQPPHFLSRLIRKRSKRTGLFAPLILGAFTVFIPCGTTQAVMALAIASGNPFTGAALLFMFTLGTSPLFFFLGYLTAKLGETLQFAFAKIAAVLIILFAIFNLNNAIALQGAPYTLETIAAKFWCFLSYCEDSTQPFQRVSNTQSIVIDNNGYNPREFTVKAGLPVTIQLHNTDGNSCAQAFTIPSLGIQKVVPVGRSDTVAFTAPHQPGNISFMCSMGMYRGIIHVI